MKRLIALLLCLTLALGATSALADAQAVQLDAAFTADSTAMVRYLRALGVYENELEQQAELMTGLMNSVSLNLQVQDEPTAVMLKVMASNKELLTLDAQTLNGKELLRSNMLPGLALCVDETAPEMSDERLLLAMMQAMAVLQNWARGIETTPVAGPVFGNAYGTAESGETVLIAADQFRALHQMLTAQDDVIECLAAITDQTAEELRAAMNEADVTSSVRVTFGMRNEQPIGLSVTCMESDEPVLTLSMGQNEQDEVLLVACYMQDDITCYDDVKLLPGADGGSLVLHGRHYATDGSMAYPLLAEHMPALAWKSTVKLVDEAHISINNEITNYVACTLEQLQNDTVPAIMEETLIAAAGDTVTVNTRVWMSDMPGADAWAMAMTMKPIDGVNLPQITETIVDPDDQDELVQEMIALAAETGVQNLMVTMLFTLPPALVQKLMMN